MKHLSHFIQILFVFAFLIPAAGQTVVKDYDGNLYKTVKAGNQVWMAENLKVVHYSNGDPIPNVREAAIWKNLTAGAYCHVSNKPENARAFGLIYNWYTTTDERNVCPTAWHVPSDSDWDALVIFLSGGKGPGEVLPENTTINENLFQILPQDFRGFDGEFSGLGYGGGGWWSSTSGTEDMAFYRGVNYNTVSSQHLEWSKKFGYHIRCIKD